jgi:hypothetical protein
MATVDVSAEIEIAAAPADVAAVLFDPVREPEWMKVVKSVSVIDPALQPGARVRRTAMFMGHEIAWVTEVETVHFPHVLNLKVAEGPFVGTINYQIQRSAGGSHVRIRNRGESSALSFLPASIIETPLKASMEADLGRLKAIVEKV